MNNYKQRSSCILYTRANCKRFVRRLWFADSTLSNDADRCPNDCSQDQRIAEIHGLFEAEVLNPLNGCFIQEIKT